MSKSKPLIGYGATEEEADEACYQLRLARARKAAKRVGMKLVDSYALVDKATGRAGSAAKDLTLIDVENLLKKLRQAQRAGTQGQGADPAMRSRAAQRDETERIAFKLAHGSFKWVKGLDDRPARFQWTLWLDGECVGACIPYRATRHWIGLLCIAERGVPEGRACKDLRVANRRVVERVIRALAACGYRGTAGRRREPREGGTRPASGLVAAATERGVNTGCRGHPCHRVVAKRCAAQIFASSHCGCRGRSPCRPPRR
jgi:hypothetical protein